MLEEFCTDISHKLGKFVEGIGKLHNEEMKESNEEAPKKRRQRNPAAAKVVKKKKATQNDAQQGQDATTDVKDTEDVDEEKEQDDDNDDEVASDGYHGPDRGDDGDGGQVSQAKSKGTGQTDAILGSWLRNSTKTKGDNVGSPSKTTPSKPTPSNETPGRKKQESSSLSHAIAEPHREFLNSVFADQPSAVEQPSDQLQKICPETQQNKLFNEFVTKDPSPAECKGTEVQEPEAKCRVVMPVSKDKGKSAARRASAKTVKIARKFKKIAYHTVLTLPVVAVTEGIPNAAKATSANTNKGSQVHKGIGRASTESANNESQVVEAIAMKGATQNVAAVNLGGQGVDLMQIPQARVNEQIASTASVDSKKQVSAMSQGCLADQAAPAQDGLKGEEVAFVEGRSLIRAAGPPGHQPRKPTENICAPPTPSAVAIDASCAGHNAINRANSAGSVHSDHLCGSNLPSYPIQKNKSRDFFNGMDFAPPPFDLGFGSQPEPPQTIGGPAISAKGIAVGKFSLNSGTAACASTSHGHTVIDDEWDDAMVVEACALADRIDRERATGAVTVDQEAVVDLSTPPEGKAVLGLMSLPRTRSSSGAIPKPKMANAIIDLCTPPPPARSIEGKENFGSISAKSSSSSAPQQGPERRAIKPPACKRPPFVDIESKATYQCSNDVKEVYAAVLATGRRNTRAKVTDERKQGMQNDAIRTHHASLKRWIFTGSVLSSLKCEYENLRIA
ncbi:uncharacterized protein LOC100838783 isoform X3 [Brachypodium distachyon]|uniref:uncharacterized protein LOC100838783 isoform X3 n=1 Tax=Brachypodium distachyon TaxID=15368 RepID=UPI00052FF571|nr:uncharacterized protein LOC100838783 isoform X3 [Brachypodium distachyon]|eukprot:XP_024315102.1 uncharacterized protein LOC100838783 isoform X3 [Brachypodium distachyon]